MSYTIIHFYFLSRNQERLVIGLFNDEDILNFRMEEFNSYIEKMYGNKDHKIIKYKSKRISYGEVFENSNRKFLLLPRARNNKCYIIVDVNNLYSFIEYKIGGINKIQFHDSINFLMSPEDFHRDYSLVDLHNLN